MADKLDIILDEVKRSRGETKEFRKEMHEFRREVWTAISPLQAEAAVSEEHRDQCKQKHSHLTTIAVAVLVVVLGAAGFAFTSWLETKTEVKNEAVVKALP